jgi:hypothetical protein
MNSTKKLMLGFDFIDSKQNLLIKIVELKNNLIKYSSSPKCNDFVVKKQQEVINILEFEYNEFERIISILINEIKEMEQTNQNLTLKVKCFESIIINQESQIIALKKYGK